MNNIQTRLYKLYLILSLVFFHMNVIANSSNLELYQKHYLGAGSGSDWGLKLTFEQYQEGFPLKGKFEFRNLKCGGEFQTTLINKSESKVVLSQNMTYGNCVRGCSIVLTNGLNEYIETCNSKFTGGGKLQQTDDKDHLLSLLDITSDFDVSANFTKEPTLSEILDKGHKERFGDGEFDRYKKTEALANSGANNNQQSAPATSTATNSNQPNSSSGICNNPSIPNPNSLENETLEFYGVCDQSNRAMTGLVVFKLNDTAYSIDCLHNGNYGDTLGKFDACSPYWTILPNYCKVDNYKGQCIKGVPNGVGQNFHEEYDRIKGEGSFNILAAAFGNRPVAADVSIGMFSNGKLDGYGDYFAISGCGMVGCTGNRIKKHGWFEKGQFKFECANINECSKKVSGKAFTSKFKAKKSNPQTASSVSNGDFQSYLSSFEETGNISDLREAKKLAKTKSEKAALEFNILRTAGYEKVFSLKTIITNGNKSVDASDSERLMGFFRSVNSSLPIKVKWSVKPLSTVMTLKDGVYNSKLRVGLSVNKNIESCLGSFCQTNKDVENYEKLVDVTLSPKNKYSASGVYDLSVAGTSTSVVFGVASVNDISDIESIIAIDSVELAQ